MYDNRPIVEMKILNNCVLFAVFVAIFVSGWSLDHTIVTARLFLPHGIIRPPTTTERDDTGSYVLTNCEKELIEIKEAVGYFDLYFQEKATPSQQGLNSYLQRVFLDCLINNGFPDLAADHSVDKYFDFSPRFRRLSADDPLSGPESTSSSSERSLGPNDSPSQPGKKSAKRNRTHKRKAPRKGRLTSSKELRLEYERKTSSEGGSSSNGIQIMNLEAIPPNDVTKRQPNLIAPIVAAAGSMISIVAVVVLFCARRDRSKHGQKDEKPLLTEIQSQKLASSDYSETKELGKGGFSFRSDGAHESLPENDVEAPASSGALTPLPGRAPPPPPPPPPQPSGLPPPPPPKGRAPPALPLRGGQIPAAPKAQPGSSHGGNDGAANSGAHRTKLKPFFWDKVLATPEHAMVWDEIRAGSFQFNEEMIETLFGYNPDAKKNNDRRGRNVNSATPLIQIIDSKKAQNLAILLKALNVTTEEVHDALLEGTELPAELLQTLLKMQPTTEEEVKLRLYSGDLSQIGSAERFLKAMVEIPFAFKRMECLLFMMTLKEEVSGLRDSFATLEVASKTLRSSRLFLKLLEAVLKTGNRMNDGTYRGGAQAFKLDTLLKLSDVKGKDGKTTLLHFVVQEIIRTEGIKVARRMKGNKSASSIKSDDLIDDPMVDPTNTYRALGLQVLSGLSTELAVVKKAAIIDSDTLVSTVSKLGQSLLKTKDFLNKEMQDLGEESRFYLVLKDFVEDSEEEVKWLIEEERRIMEMVKKTVDYFHGNSSKDEGLRLFVIVRDFLILLDRICVEIKRKMEQAAKTTRKETSTKTSPQNSPTRSLATPDKSQKLFPALSDNNSSDHDSSSDTESRTSSTKENSAIEESTDRDSRRQTSVEEQTIEVPSQDRQSEECSDSSSSDEGSDTDKDSLTCTKESPAGSEQLKKTSSQEKVMEQMRQKLFPVIQDKRFDDYSSSSDDEN